MSAKVHHVAKGSRVKRVFQSMKDGTKCNQLGLVKLVVIAFLYGFVCRWQILIMCWKNRITLANIILQSTAYFGLNYSTPQWTILSASSGYMMFTGLGDYCYICENDILKALEEATCILMNFPP